MYNFHWFDDLLADLPCARDDPKYLSALQKLYGTFKFVLFYDSIYNNIYNHIYDYINYNHIYNHIYNHVYNHIYNHLK